MKIDVTQKDIDLALQARAAGEHPYTCCPIAQAMRTALDTSVGVNGSIAYTDTDRFELPDIAREFQKTFDQKRAVEPFAFEINDGRNTSHANGLFRPLHRLE